METLLELPLIERPTGPPLLDALLVEQQSLTAVARFARLHETGHAAPAQERYYRDLVPLAVPQPGEQYAFEVDLDACSGCKACVTACHSLNGLDEGETFRDVGLLTGRDVGGLHILQHVSTACHHCVEPACLSGCPTRAYDKDPVTGIVRHLDDQCIGCQYCTLMCPYDVPKYNAAKGIVRKCDMCRQRLTDGEAPACVQACPNQAIRISLVRTGVVQALAQRQDFLPLAPDPRLTLPTTRFLTRREPLRDIQPVEELDRPAHAHLPLVFMLVLTQMSIGMFIVAELLLLAGTKSVATVIAAALIGLVGLSAAVLHLGRPQIAYRAWLGWRTSWMSREIIVFHLWLACALPFTATMILPDADFVAGTFRVPSSSLFLTRHILGLATALTGLAALLCSAMIYVVTRREFWSAGRAIPRFAVTAALLGAAGVATIFSVSAAPLAPILVAAVVAMAFARILTSIAQQDQSQPKLSRSLGLLTGPLSPWHTAQTSLLMLGGLILPLTILEAPRFTLPLAIAMTFALLMAELIDRGLFFAAAVAPRMPGVPPS